MTFVFYLKSKLNALIVEGLTALVNIGDIDFCIFFASLCGEKGEY